MKKTGKITVLFTLMLVLLFSMNASAASKTTTFKKAISYYKKGNYTTAQKYFNKLPKKASEKYVKSMPTQMKKEFKKAVQAKNVTKKGFITTYMLNGYYLTDMDNDKQPELLITYGTCEADMALYIYKYTGRNAKLIDKVPAGHTSYYQDPTGKGFYQLWGHQGCEGVSFVSLNGNKIKFTSIGSREIRFSSGEEYISFPYILDGHIRWDKNYKRSVDFSPFN